MVFFLHQSGQTTGGLSCRNDQQLEEVAPMSRKFTVRFIGLMLAFAFFGSSAFAQFRLRIEDVTNSVGVVITDNGANDSAPAIGQITFNGSIGTNFTVNVTTGLSKPIIGTGTAGQIDLNSVNVASTGPGVLRITLEDT